MSDKASWVFPEEGEIARRRRHMLLQAALISFGAGAMFTSTARATQIFGDNFYIAENGGAVEYNTSGVSITTQTLTSAQGQPEAVAVDSSGNIYISGYNTTGSVVEVTPTSFGSGTASVFGQTGTLGDSPPSGPVGVAFDPAGNFYVAGYSHAVYQYNSSGNIQQTIASGPTGSDLTLTIDSSGNMYVGNFTSSLIYKYATTGSGSPGTPYTTLATVPGSGAVEGMTTDSAGDLFVADYESGSSKSVIYEYTAAAPTVAVSFATVPYYNSSTNANFLGLAFDASGNLFTTGWLSATNTEMAVWQVGQTVGGVVGSVAPQEDLNLGATTGIHQFAFDPVPEPATAGLFGMIGVAAMLRRKR